MNFFHRRNYVCGKWHCFFVLECWLFMCQKWISCITVYCGLVRSIIFSIFFLLLNPCILSEISNEIEKKNTQMSLTQMSLSWP